MEAKVWVRVGGGQNLAEGAVEVPEDTEYDLSSYQFNRSALIISSKEHGAPVGYSKLAAASPGS